MMRGLSRSSAQKLPEETKDIHRLITKARYAQFGPDWSLTNPDKGAFVQRIQALADILGEVTNTLEAVIKTPTERKLENGRRSNTHQTR